MKKQYRHSVLLLLMAGYVAAQSLTLPLLKARFIRYGGQFYAYGYQLHKSDLHFQCYRFNTALALTDSATLNMGKHSPDEFLDITADTLHDVLSFYFQKTGQKNSATLFRVSNALKQLAYVEDVDASRINTLTAFEDEKYAYKNSVYLVRTRDDEQNRQFFLSKFTVLSVEKPFEYKQDWQFAFERNYIHRASVIYANDDVVMVYAHVSDSIKKGQWILKIDTHTGELLKGIRINKKNEPRNYLYSGSVYNPQTREFICEGFVVDQAALDFKTGAWNPALWPKYPTVFVTRIDSAGRVSSSVVKTLIMPIAAAKQAGQVTYHLKIRDIQNFPADKKLITWYDVYEMGGDRTLKYLSSWSTTADLSEPDAVITPSPFYVSTAVIPGFIGSAKGDMYGKSWVGDMKQYDKFLYKKMLLPVVISTFSNAAGNPVYVLFKQDLGSGERTYHLVAPGKKGLEDKVLFKSGKSSALYVLNPSTYISCESNDVSAILKVGSF